MMKPGYRETTVDIADAVVVESKTLNERKWRNEDIAVLGVCGVVAGYFFGKRQKAKSRKRK